MRDYIAGTALLYKTQALMRRSIKQMFADMSRKVQGVIKVYSVDDKIPVEREGVILREVGRIVSGYFVGMDGRSAFAADGITPLADYPAILNYYLSSVQRGVVEASGADMRASMPSDMVTWFQARVKSPVVREQDDPKLARLKALGRAMRLFADDPLAQYEPAHTWVDPSGYRLSDRVWRSSEDTRQKIDAMIADNIRNGTGSARLSKMVEKFLQPDQKGIRTDKPYGRDASFSGMRLARTEITRAHGAATIAAANANPYVDGMDWALSASHPKFDVCDGNASIGMGGGRLREPYALGDIPQYPAHPHCLCC